MFASVTISLLKLLGQVGSELYKLPCLARLRLELRRFLHFRDFELNLFKGSRDRILQNQKAAMVAEGKR